jgi:hypothetical protein
VIVGVLVGVGVLVNVGVIVGVFVAVFVGVKAGPTVRLKCVSVPSSHLFLSEDLKGA